MEPVWIPRRMVMSGFRFLLRQTALIRLLSAITSSRIMQPLTVVGVFMSVLARMLRNMLLVLRKPITVSSMEPKSNSKIIWPVWNLGLPVITEGIVVLKSPLVFPVSLVLLTTITILARNRLMALSGTMNFGISTGQIQRIFSLERIKTANTSNSTFSILAPSSMLGTISLRTSTLRFRKNS